MDMSESNCDKKDKNEDPKKPGLDAPENGKQAKYADVLMIPCGSEDDALTVNTLVSELKLRTGGAVKFTIGVDELLSTIAALQLAVRHPGARTARGLRAWVMKEAMIAYCNTIVPGIGAALHRLDGSAFDDERNKRLLENKPGLIVPG
jgi:hypothetical protein